MGIFEYLIHCYFHSSENITEEAFSKHLLNDCWTLTARRLANPHHISEKQVVASLIHFKARETLRHDIRRCPDATLPQSPRHKKKVVFPPGLCCSQSVSVFIIWGKVYLRKTQDRPGIEREKPHSLQGEVCCVLWDEMNHVVLLLNSSLSKSSNGNWPMAKDYQIHFTPESRKILREMSFNA